MGKLFSIHGNAPARRFMLMRRNEKKIIVFLSATFALAVLSFIWLCPPYSFNDPKGLGVNILGYVLFSMILPVLYYYFMNQFTRGLEPYIVSDKKMPFVLNWFILLLFIHLMGISTGLYVFSFSSLLINILIVISGICSVLLIYLIYLAYITKGHFLQKIRAK